MTSWLFIHGAGSSRLTWTYQLGAVSPMKRIDLPNLGGAPETLIERLAAWSLEHLSDRTVVVGHSMGGAIAQTIARQAPSRVAGLVLVGTGPILPVNPVIISGIADILPKIARWSLGEKPNPTIYQNSLQRLQEIDPQRLRREFVACNLFDSRQWLSEINAPVAIIMGAQDRMTPPSLSQQFLDYWPDALTYSMVAGHLMMLEQPRAFNDILHSCAKRYDWHG